jgi:hypothetical protein
MRAIRIIHLAERRPHVLTGALRKLRRAYNCFSLLNQYVADSYVSDDAGENYACNTLAFKMTRFLCVPRLTPLRSSPALDPRPRSATSPASRPGPPQLCQVSSLVRLAPGCLPLRLMPRWADSATLASRMNKPCECWKHRRTLFDGKKNRFCRSHQVMPLHEMYFRSESISWCLISTVWSVLHSFRRGRSPRVGSQCSRRNLPLLVLLLTLLSAGCSTHFSTLQPEGTSTQVIYTIPEEQAFQIAFTALATTLPGRKIEIIDGPRSRIQHLLSICTRHIYPTGSRLRSSRDRPSWQDRSRLLFRGVRQRLILCAGEGEEHRVV